MNFILSMAWRLDVESITRFENLYPHIAELYSGISIVLPPNSDEKLIKRIAKFTDVKLLIGKKLIENRRYLTIQQALEFDTATHIHYCDGDHVLSRLENYLDDWKQSSLLKNTLRTITIMRSTRAK